MSAAAARVNARPARPAPRPPARAAGSRPAALRLVSPRRSSAARAPFVAVVVLILAGGLLGLLLLNTVLAQDAFRLHSLQVQGRALTVQEQVLQREVERLQAPQWLAARATQLGMVPGGAPAFLRLSDGKVLGDAVPAPAPVAAVSSPASPAAASPAAASPAAGTRPTGRPAPGPAAGTWVSVPPAQPAGKPARKPTPQPTRGPR